MSHKWFHSFSGIQGAKSTKLLMREWNQMNVDVKGKRVLDIGTRDGWFAFQAEKAGAEEVVALDSWAPEHGRQGSRYGFDHMHEKLQSKVKPCEADWMTVSLPALGMFDVVFFLGVLYHLTDPFEGLKRVRQVTDGSAFVETQAFRIPSQDQPLWQFFPETYPNGDHSVWFVPNESAALGLCRAVGFTSSQTLHTSNASQYRLLIKADHACPVLWP